MGFRHPGKAEVSTVRVSPGSLHRASIADGQQPVNGGDVAGGSAEFISALTRALEDCLRDEPQWRGRLEVTEVELDHEPPRSTSYLDTDDDRVLTFGVRLARVRCPVKFEEEVADTAVVVKRLCPKFLRVRDPVWRETLAVRVGLPVLGAVVAVTFAWLITQV
jgi:hypothetical protein